VKVLVAVASKYGGTREIGQAITDELRTRKLEVDFRELGTASSLDGFDAVVIGSAVYLGHWLEPAKNFAQQHADRLVKRPT
jgi:menaquinone-dependent protoporphyrinogen oxidase